MNIIWKILILFSLVMMVFSSPKEVLPAFLLGSSSALNLSIELLSIYAVWLGLIKIIEKTSISRGLAWCLSPVIDFCWGKNISKEAKNYISLSLSASLLGIGGAAVPLGIKAIEELDDKSGKVNFPIIMTIVFASAGLQFLPTTIMSLMSNAGSTNPSFIVIPTFLSGLVTLSSGIGLSFLFRYIAGRKK